MQDLTPTQGKPKLPDMRLKRNTDLLQRVRDRFEAMSKSDQENRDQAMEDLKFTNVPGYQWDSNMKQERGSRPCYEYNKLRVSCKRVINQMRGSRPQGKFRAVENGDKPTADILEGLGRNIWTVSDADTVIDQAAEFQVPAGIGAWRVVTKYANDDSFDQDIYVEGIPNPFTLYWDENSRDPMHRDARDWALTGKVSHDVFKNRYGDKMLQSFSSGNHSYDNETWYDDDSVRIVEYWYYKPEEVTFLLLRLENGATATVRSDQPDFEDVMQSGAVVERERTLKVNKIYMVKASGVGLLTEPELFPGPHFPFIVVHGEWQMIDGRPYWWGMTRFARDAQQSYNVSRTAIAETIAQAPKSFIFATADQAAGNEKRWVEAHKKNLPFMLYTPDPMAPGPPQRIGGADVPVALMQQASMDSEDLKAVTGIFDPSLGMRSNETSGRAIFARQQQGEIATFNFQDNQAKGVQRTYEVILGMIPYVYDTERELRILGADGMETYERINQVVQLDDGSVERVNDITTGKYDVTVDVQPNFQTLRQEAAELYTGLLSQFPDLMGVAGDLIMKSLDLPYAEDIAERMRFLLPPQIQQTLMEGMEDIPPEVQQMMQMLEQQAQALQEQEQALAQAAQEVEEQKRQATEESSRANVDKKDVEIRIERLRRETAEARLRLAEAAQSTLQGDDSTAEIEDLKAAVQSLDMVIATVLRDAGSSQPTQ